jgi:hypothetical protein
MNNQTQTALIPTPGQNGRAERAVCGRVDSVVIRQRQLEYLEATKQLVEAKAEIYSLAVTTATICKGVVVEYRYDFTPEQEEVLRLADDAIEAVKARIFGV